MQQIGIGRRIFFGALAAWLVGALLFVAARDVLAAIELAYFRASSTNSSVLLEWATIREVNLNGFEILCKRASEPDTAYHPIGSRIAQGGPQTPATYNFNVTTGLTFGESYCFRLREVTSDGVPGEIFELCGYGPGITPTPTVPGAGVLTFTAPITAGAGLLPTPITVENVPGLEAAPTLIPTPTPTVFGVPPVSPTLQPTPTLFVDPDQPVSPLPQPGAIVPNLPDPNAAAAGMQQFDPNATPTVDPLLTLPTSIPTETATVVPTPTETATPIAQSPQLPQAVDPAPLPAAVAALPAGATGATGIEGTQMEPSPTPLYVVVTATPTPEGLAVIPPIFTPWPTTAPTPSFSFASVLAPNTQNLMVMLLCLIFFSASALGILGLITSVLYMRSQSRRDGLPSPYDRRRF